jgi:hypothetical protein
MQDIREWLREITAFTVAVGASDEKRTELTVSESYPVTLEAADRTLSVTSERELPPEVQGVVDMSQLKEAAFGQARAAAMPTLSETKEVGGKQWASFRIPLHLDGLTRNELATAIWEVWKAQEMLVSQIEGFKELETLSAELEGLEAEAEPPLPEAPPAEVAPPTAPAAAAEPQPAPPPAPAPPEAVPAEAAPPPPTSPAGRFCPKCGKQAKPEQRFCIGCGAPV